jgi:hypothetical protein
MKTPNVCNVLRHALTFLAPVLLLAAGCGEEPPPSLYDPAYTSGPTPSITSVSPQGYALAGVHTITITGTNFSTVLGENLIYFNSTLVPALSGSGTQLVVKAPVLVGDTVRIKIARYGSDKFNTPFAYRLDAAVANFGGFAKPDEPTSVECDANGYVYVSLITSNVGGGVKRISPNGTPDAGLYAPAYPSSVLRWSGMKMGPGGVLHTVGLAGLFVSIYQIPAGGGTPAAWVNFARGVTMSDLDFDQAGNVWLAGASANIYRVKPTKTSKTFPFLASATIRSVRVFGSYLYVGGKVDVVEGVWRLPLIGDSLGTASKYFDLTAAYPNTRVNAITFAQDGDMFLATNVSGHPLLLVSPTGSYQDFYPGLFPAENIFLTYGRADTLYVSRTGPGTGTDAYADKKLLKVVTQKTGAPYYGR